MSKFVKILVALLATVAVATPALAIDADVKGYFAVRGIAYDNVKDMSDDEDDNVRGVDSRFRIWFTGAASENAKMVVGFEADNTWGAPDALGDIGADAKSRLEIKHAYLDFKVQDAAVKVGAMGWSQGRGYIISDDASGLRVVKPLNGGNLAFSWIKVAEGEDTNADGDTIPAINDDNADKDYYSLQYDTKVAGWSVVPFVGYYDLGENDEAYFLGASADGKVGDFGVALTAIVNDWEQGDEDGNGLALFAKGTYAVNASTFSAEVGYMGDEDNTNGEFFDVSNYNNFAEVLAGGKFDARGQVGNSTVGDSFMNLLYVKATAAHKYGEKHSVSASLIYAKTAEDGYKGIDDTVTLGTEIDAYYNYKITKGLTFTAGGGYLLADDELAEALAGDATASADDAWKVGTMLTYKF